MVADTPGKRVYLVRLALGDGLRTPLSMDRFAALLTERTGRRYDSSMLSRIENGDRKVTLDDCAAIAPLDPHARGPGWIAWGERETPRSEEQGVDDFAPDPIRDRAIGAAAIQRAREARDAEDREKASTTEPAKRPAKRAHRKQG